jgi:hypothetical protein
MKITVWFPEQIEVDPERTQEIAQLIVDRWNTNFPEGECTTAAAEEILMELGNLDEIHLPSGFRIDQDDNQVLTPEEWGEEE